MITYPLINKSYEFAEHLKRIKKKKDSNESINYEHIHYSNAWDGKILIKAIKRYLEGAAMARSFVPSVLAIVKLHESLPFIGPPEKNIALAC